MNILRFVLSTLFLFFGSLYASAAPTYAPVPAAPHHHRDGLGRFFAKAQQGGEVRVAYLGGSITAANGWRPMTTARLKKDFPKAAIHEIHAAIGGTGSDLGVYRLERDVLRHKPDLLFVEFAVNDGGAQPENIWRAMEGIVRQTWTALPNCDICFVYTFRVNYEKDLREGLCPRAASADEMLAAHYGIPSINFALPVVQMETAGRLVFQGEKDAKLAEGVILFSTDGVHPLDAGHVIYADAVSKAFSAWRRQDAKPIDHNAKLKMPFIADHWQDARMVAVKESMLEGGWAKLDPGAGLGKSFGNRVDGLWLADKPGQKLRFKFKGSAVKLYDLLGPDGGQAIVTVDGKPLPRPIARFDSYCTYHRLATLNIAQGLDPDQVHEVIVEVHPDQPSRQPVAFRLKDPENELKAPKYQGTKLWVGGILMRGELVE